MSTSAAVIDPRTSKRDHRQEVTDSIIAMLEKGVAPWQKPWEGAAMPFNPTTEKSYRGGNAVHLLATSISRGYEDPRWMTYKQAAQQGWQVRKGERGTHIEYWEVRDQSARTSSEPEQTEAGKDKSDRRLIHRVFTVFNAKQIDGVPKYERPEKSAFGAIQSGERILANSGATIAHVSATLLSTTGGRTAFTCRPRRPSKMRRAITAQRSMSWPTGPEIRRA